MSAESKDVVEVDAEHLPADEENELQNWWNQQDQDEQWIEENS